MSRGRRLAKRQSLTRAKRFEGAKSAANIRELKCLRLDIEGSPQKAASGEGYASPQDAKRAVLEFCMAVGLLNPQFVFSGHGVHAYWPLRAAVSLSEWLPYAEGLKAACKAHGLIADPAITADPARILRVPGTQNFKGSATAEVSLDPESQGEGPYELDSFLPLLTYEPEHTATADHLQPATHLWSLGYEAYLRSQLFCLSADIPYPEWFKFVAAIHSLGWGETGFTMADDWSQTALHRYDPDALRILWENLNKRDGTWEGSKVTWATIDHLATEAGWTPEEAQNAQKAAEEADRAQAAREQLEKAKQSGIDVSAVETVLPAFIPFNPGTPGPRKRRRQTLRDFIKVDPLTIRVDGLIPSGALYTLTAKRGHNKTAFCINLALALGFNRGDLIGKEIEPCRVLYMTAENPDMLKRRLRLSLVKFGIDLDQFPEERLCAIGGFLNPSEMIEECQDMMREAERAGEQFGLAIIDTLQAYFNGDDSNSNAQVVKFLRSLRPITELAHKPTVLVPAHPTKHAGEDELVPYGGGGILNEIDGNLTLSLKESVVTLHYQDKLRGVPFEPAIYKSALEMADELTDQRGRTVELPVLRPARIEELKEAEEREAKANDKLLRVLAKGKQPSAWAAGAEAGIPKTTAIDAIKELKALKLIKRGGSPPQGSSRSHLLVY